MLIAGGFYRTLEMSCMKGRGLSLGICFAFLGTPGPSRLALDIPRTPLLLLGRSMAGASLAAFRRLPATYGLQIDNTCAVCSEAYCA
jgi:hypothetical protein